MTELVFLEYSFIFDPKETWEYLADFEKDLQDFFGSYGLEARTMKAIETSESKRIVLITRVAPSPLPLTEHKKEDSPEKKMMDSALNKMKGK